MHNFWYKAYHSCILWLLWTFMKSDSNSSKSSGSKISISSWSSVNSIFPRMPTSEVLTIFDFPDVSGFPDVFGFLDIFGFIDFLLNILRTTNVNIPTPFIMEFNLIQLKFIEFFWFFSDTSCLKKSYICINNKESLRTIRMSDTYTIYQLRYAHSFANLWYSTVVHSEIVRIILKSFSLHLLANSECIVNF